MKQNTHKVKKCYIVKRGDAIYQVSSNLQAAYKALASHKSEMDVSYLRSYMQLTRIFKISSTYYVPSNSGPRWELILLPIVTKYTATP